MTLKKRISLADQVKQSPAGVSDAAAARASVQALSIMGRAHRASRMKQAEIARNLGVSEGRVSQILNGDGNVRVSTLARVLAATGFDLILESEPKDGEESPDPSTALGRQRSGYVAVELVPGDNTEAGDDEAVIILSTTHPRALGKNYDMVYSLSSGDVELNDEPQAATKRPKFAQWSTAHD